MGSTLIDLHHLVDLSLGTPESGAVNFNVLHALLHSIVQLLNAENVRVELIDTPICKPEKPGQGIVPRHMIVEEYKLDSKGQDDKKTLVKKPLLDAEKIIVVRKNMKEGEVDAESIHTTKTQKSDKKTSSNKEPAIAATSKDVADTKGEITVDKTQPAATATTAAATTAASAGVVDLEQVMNIAKRMDSADIRFNQIEKSLEELSKKYETMKTVGQQVLDNVHDTQKGSPDKKSEIKPKDESTSRTSRVENPKNTQVFGEKQLSAIQEEVRNLKNEVDQLKIKIQQGIRSSTYQEVGRQSVTDGNKKPISPNASKSPTRKERITCPPSSARNTEQEYCHNLGKTLNHKFEVLSGKFLTMNDRILDMEKDLCEMIERFEESKEAKDGKTAQITISDLHNELMGIKALITDTANNCNFLLGEREQIYAQISKVAKILEELSNTKVDREDVEELMSEKADYNMLQRKVSIDYFDASKRDMENSMLESIRQSQEREKEWCNTIENLKRQLELKLNAAEITAVKDYLERRLQMLADRMNVLCAAGKEPEAAGTRFKMLTNLNCISCNQHVLMKKEEIHKIPKVQSLPAHKSLKPFLTYELDSLRKQMKDIPNSRNMHHFEAMFKDRGLIMDDKTRKICNRYCGGSHTIITAQDRIEKGRCGRMYGARGTTAKCICGEPEPPPCTCPDEPEQPLVCVCPDEPEVCPCSSEEDPFDKCLTAREKRCLDIDRERREKCNSELDRRRQRCKEEMDRREKCAEEMKRREKCKTETVKRDKCSPEAFIRERCSPDLEKRDVCSDELKKYTRCKELNKTERKGGSYSGRTSSVGRSSCLEPKHKQQNSSSCYDTKRVSDEDKSSSRKLTSPTSPPVVKEYPKTSAESQEDVPEMLGANEDNEEVKIEPQIDANVESQEAEKPVKLQDNPEEQTEIKQETVELEQTAEIEENTEQQDTNLDIAPEEEA